MLQTARSTDNFDRDLPAPIHQSGILASIPRQLWINVWFAPIFNAFSGNLPATIGNLGDHIYTLKVLADIHQEEFFQVFLDLPSRKHLHQCCKTLYDIDNAHKWKTEFDDTTERLLRKGVDLNIAYLIAANPLWVPYAEVVFQDFSIRTGTSQFICKNILIDHHTSGELETQRSFQNVVPKVTVAQLQEMRVYFRDDIISKWFDSSLWFRTKEDLKLGNRFYADVFERYVKVDGQKPEKVEDVQLLYNSRIDIELFQEVGNFLASIHGGNRNNDDLMSMFGLCKSKKRFEQVLENTEGIFSLREFLQRLRGDS